MLLKGKHIVRRDLFDWEEGCPRIWLRRVHQIKRIRTESSVILGPVKVAISVAEKLLASIFQYTIAESLKFSKKNRK